MKKQWSIFLTTLLLVGQSEAGVETFLREAQGLLTELKHRCLYYKPYVITSGTLYTAYTVRNYPLLRNGCLMGTMGYVLYAWNKGLRDIKNIKRKYGISYKQANHWDESRAQVGVSFATWRLYDMIGDGCFWPNAQCMTYYKEIIKEKLLTDICQGKILVFNEYGQKITSPTPQDVFNAIDREINALTAEKDYIKRYTSIYRTFNAEDFHKDDSAWRILWPNYNRASLLYIDIVTMLERLEILKEIAGDLRAQAGLAGWPALF